MNRLMALVKREFWENKGAFRTTPLVIGGLHIIGLLMLIITIAYFDTDFQSLKEFVSAVSQTEVGLRDKILYEMTLGGSVFFSIVLSIVVFFYLLGSLYDDRKDRSILFWKSLPASDTLTLASKLLAAMVVAPLIFWIAYVLTQVVSGLIFAIVVLWVGENPWTLFLSLGDPFQGWSMVLLTYMAQSIWALPLYGWLMLVSAFSPRIPLLFAILPPVVLGVLELWIDFLKTFTINENFFGLYGHWVANSPAILSLNVRENGHQFDIGTALGFPMTHTFDHDVTVSNIFDRLFSLNMLAGLIIAAVFLAAALWLRHRATES